MAHRGELRAGADVRRPEHRVARRHGAAPGGVGPLLGEALLAMTRSLLITNPAAARTDARAVTAIRDTLRSGGWSVEVLATTQPGDARRFAREGCTQGFDVLVCYGGDGTARQIAAGAVGSGIPLGLVPGGTGNLLAGNLRLRRFPVPPGTNPSGMRSEEHTSELQSQFHLVCRILLEKKKKSNPLPK